MAETKHRVLVLGASGMLGNAVLRFFAAEKGYETWGSVRSSAAQSLLPQPLRDRVMIGVDVDNTDSLTRLLGQVHPTVVINCVGLVKQVAGAHDPYLAIAINSLLPHRLAHLCELTGARFVHISTDCVFAGTKGMYREEDAADAADLYGRSKYLGEVDYPHAITLRTSIIGPELASAHGLIGWFLAQRGSVKGFTRAIFSGLPTRELARVIAEYVLPRPELRGVYHVSSAPISKYELLRLVSQVYGRDTAIMPDDQLVIDRSLDSSRFRQLTGYSPPAWPQLVQAMQDFN